MKIKALTGRPPVIGYYMAISDPRIRLTKADKYPKAMYWNGEEWQDKSDEDYQTICDGDSPAKFELKWFPRWFMIEPEEGGTMIIMAQKMEVKK